MQRVNLPAGPEDTGRHAWRRSADSSLLYAEGYACRPIGEHLPVSWAWCLDGDSVVDPGSNQPYTAYFGVALRPGYVRRVRAAQRNDDDGFMWALAHHEANEVISPPLDPATDIVSGLARDIPSSVREWALTSERHPGGARQPPAWVLEELLGFGDRQPPDPPDPWLQALGLPLGRQPTPDTVASPQRLRDVEPSEDPFSLSYAPYLVRRADWFDSEMALQCSAETGGVFTDDGTIIGKIRVGDSLDTLIRMADEHRPRCGWATVYRADEREHPELTVQRRIEVHLKWVRDELYESDFGMLRRVGHAWEAWLQPRRVEGQAMREQSTEQLIGTVVSYEMALGAIFRAMGDEMPEEFMVSYVY